MVLCNQYINFTQAADGTYTVTASSLYPGVLQYKIIIAGVSNTSFQNFTLSVNQSKSFELPEDGVYIFQVLNNANSNPIFIDNVLELRKTLACFDSLLFKIGNPTIELVKEMVCDPCNPYKQEVCTTCGVTKTYNQKEVVNFINAMFPYLFKIIYTVVPERLELVGLHTVDDEASLKRRNLLKEAFSDIKAFTTACGSDVFFNCSNTTATTKVCNCNG